MSVNDLRPIGTHFNVTVPPSPRTTDPRTFVYHYHVTAHRDTAPRGEACDCTAAGEEVALLGMTALPLEPVVWTRTPEGARIDEGLAQDLKAAWEEVYTVNSGDSPFGGKSPCEAIEAFLRRFGPAYDPETDTFTDV